MTWDELMDLARLMIPAAMAKNDLHAIELWLDAIGMNEYAACFGLD